MRFYVYQQIFQEVKLQNKACFLSECFRLFSIFSIKRGAGECPNRVQHQQHGGGGCFSRHSSTFYERDTYSVHLRFFFAVYRGKINTNMERTWKEHGKNLERTWKEHGKNLERRWYEWFLSKIARYLSKRTHFF